MKRAAARTQLRPAPECSLDAQRQFAARRTRFLGEFRSVEIQARAGGIRKKSMWLRRACGYKLANDGHDTRAIRHYLGRKNIQRTAVRYTVMSPLRLRELWRG